MELASRVMLLWFAVSTLGALEPSAPN